MCTADATPGEDTAPDTDTTSAADTTDTADAADTSADDIANDTADAADAGCTSDKQCEGVVPVTAPCEVARCEAGKCLKKPAANTTACDDGSACTTDDTCDQGTCADWQFVGSRRPVLGQA